MRFDLAAGGTHAQVVAEDGVHAGDLIRVKVVRDLEGAFAEGVDDGRWISLSEKRLPFSSSPVSRRYSGFGSQNTRRAQSRVRTIGLLLIPVWTANQSMVTTGTVVH